MFLEPREVYDSAVLGVMSLPGSSEPFIVYDKEKVMDVLRAGPDLDASGSDDDAEDLEDEDTGVDLAQEHFEFNILGGWIGDLTPAYAMTGEAKDMMLTILREQDLDEGEFVDVVPGLEHAVVGVYERFDKQGVVYDRYLLTPEQRTQLCCVDTTAEALREFEGLEPDAKRGITL